MTKRTRYDDCCIHMKHMNLSNTPQITSNIIEREYNEEETQRTIDEIESKMNNIEQSVSTRFDYLDKRMNDIDNKLGKLINLITNISDNQLYGSCPYVA